LFSGQRGHPAKGKQRLLHLYGLHQPVNALDVLGTAEQRACCGGNSRAREITDVRAEIVKETRGRR